MGDNWIEISAQTGDHITYMMPVPCGALIRHIELVEDSMAVSVSICFVPNADGKSPLRPYQFPFAELNGTSPSAAQQPANTL
jgi:hypothetical protein